MQRVRQVFNDPETMYRWYAQQNLDDFFHYVEDVVHKQQAQEKAPLDAVMQRYARLTIEHKGQILTQRPDQELRVFYRSRINLWVLLPEWVHDLYLLEEDTKAVTDGPLSFQDILEYMRGLVQLEESRSDYHRP